MEPTPKVLYTRAETAEMLSISTSTLDVAIGRGMLRCIRKGRRILVHRDEIERWAKKDTPAIWPAKRNGKATRHAFEAGAA